jgi:hypothetical protein
VNARGVNDAGQLVGCGFRSGQSELRVFLGRLPPNPDNPELIVKGSPWDH